MISFEIGGSTSRVQKALEKILAKSPEAILNRYGAMGTRYLASATPKDSGKTAASWNHRVKRTGSGYEIEWYNTNINKTVNIAVILQTGHGTGTGGYVRGIDYINPAMVPVFESIKNDIIRELTT